MKSLNAFVHILEVEIKIIPPPLNFFNYLLFQYPREILVSWSYVSLVKINLHITEYLILCLIHTSLRKIKAILKVTIQVSTLSALIEGEPFYISI